MQKPTALKIEKRCPFVANPFEECYLTSMNSQDVDLAIYYCGDHFHECEIYRRRADREPP